VAHHCAQPVHLRVAINNNVILLRRLLQVLLGLPPIPPDEQFSLNLQSKQAGEGRAQSFNVLGAVRCALRRASRGETRSTSAGISLPLAGGASSFDVLGALRCETSSRRAAPGQFATCAAALTATLWADRTQRPVPRGLRLARLSANTSTCGRLVIRLRRRAGSLC
jgi:hypothetical protein